MEMIVVRLKRRARPVRHRLMLVVFDLVIVGGRQVGVMEPTLHEGMVLAGVDVHQRRRQKPDDVADNGQQHGNR